MRRPDPKRVAKAHLARQRTKTAGEVIFKKDRSGDVGSWAYADVPPSKREIPRDFNYSPRHQKPLAQVLRSSLAALGYILMAYNRFARLKSSRLSPDGSLGGRGYIQKIQDMRKQYMNCVEAMSALSDTLYDEINAPHWALYSRQEDQGDKDDVSRLIEDVQTIREDPQEWAEKEMAEEFGSEKAPAYHFEEETEEEVDDWGEPLAGDEDERTRKNEENPNAWMNPPSVLGKTAGHRRTARDVRLALAVERVASRWAAEHRDQLPGGLADKKKPSDFDSKQLQKGIEVEREHVDGDTAKAREIAMDHLVEDPKYYDKLEKIEGGQH